MTFTLFCSAAAQRCQPELQQAAARLPEGTPVGVLAAELLADAVGWVEPALPPLVWSAEVPRRPDEPGYLALRYLAERQLLPDDWEEETLSPSSWHSMLSSFLSWYGLGSEETVGLGEANPPSPQSIVDDLAAVLEKVSHSVRPLALVASDSADRSKIAFLGVVWNWTVYPRLIVMRPDPSQSLERGVGSLLEELSNCAVELEHYVLAPEDTARRLFLTHASARMYVIGSEPQLRAWPLLVPQGDEEEFFAFEAGPVSELAAYAAAFDGGQLGIRSLMRMLPRLRTNVAPTRIPGLLRTPIAD